MKCVMGVIACIVGLVGLNRTDCVKGDQLFCNLYGTIIPVGRTRWALKMIIVKMQKGIPTDCL